MLAYRAAHRASLSRSQGAVFQIAVEYATWGLGACAEHRSPSASATGSGAQAQHTVDDFLDGPVSEESGSGSSSADGELDGGSTSTGGAGDGEEDSLPSHHSRLEHTGEQRCDGMSITCQRAFRAHFKSVQTW